MIQRIPVFFIEATDLYQVSFRRYQDPSWPGECSGPYGYHDAEVVLGFGVQLPEESRAGHKMTAEELADPACPAECDWCTFRFTEEAHSHLDVWHLYRGPDGTLYHLKYRGEHAAPPGAMWDASSWYPDPNSRSPDGMYLVLRTPAGDWNIDGKASNGPGWTRTGNPRAYPAVIDVKPSIGFGASCEHFHGWLRNGVLEQDGGTAR